MALQIHPMTFSSLHQPRTVRSLPVTISAVHTSHTQSSPPRASSTSGGRRHYLLALTSAAALSLSAVRPPSSTAESIGLFGIRKKVENVEKEAEELVKEGLTAAEKELETAEKGLESAERKLEAAAAVEVEAGYGAAAQAGIVAGAEVLGVLVAASVVNGILGPEA